MDTTTLDLRADLNVDTIRDAAFATAEQLRHVANTAQVSFAPGDATTYQILVARDMGAAQIGRTHLFAVHPEWVVVLLNFEGRPMAWNPRMGPPHWTYVVEHMCDHEHTAKVVAAFCRLLWDEMRAEVTG